MPDLMQSLQKSGKTVQCQQQDCVWLDIGRPEDYMEAIEVFEKQQAKFLRGC